MATRQQWRDQGHRLHVVRIVLDVTEQEAADVCGVTLRTYRRYEKGAKLKSLRPIRNFARHYGVSLNWLFDGEGILNSERVGRKATGKVAILPVVGPNFRRREPRPLAMFGPGMFGPGRRE
jgi:transcriptional regulator with XRE-family HTH domain